MIAAGQNPFAAPAPAASGSPQTIGVMQSLPPSPDYNKLHQADDSADYSGKHLGTCVEGMDNDMFQAWCRLMYKDGAMFSGSDRNRCGLWRVHNFDGQSPTCGGRGTTDPWRGWPTG